MNWNNFLTQGMKFVIKQKSFEQLKIILELI